MDGNEISISTDQLDTFSSCRRGFHELKDAAEGRLGLLHIPQGAGRAFDHCCSVIKWGPTPVLSVTHMDLLCHEENPPPGLMLPPAIQELSWLSTALKLWSSLRMGHVEGRREKPDNQLWEPQPSVHPAPGGMMSSPALRVFQEETSIVYPELQLQQH